MYTVYFIHGRYTSEKVFDFLLSFVSHVNLDNKFTKFKQSIEKVESTTVSVAFKYRTITVNIPPCLVMLCILGVAILNKINEKQRSEKYSLAIFWFIK